MLQNDSRTSQKKTKKVSQKPNDFMTKPVNDTLSNSSSYQKFDQQIKKIIPVTDSEDPDMP